jgi:hypothetical protein
VTGQKGNTDDTEMLTVHDCTCQRGMYKTYQEEDEDEAYTEKPDVPRTATNDDPQDIGVPSQTGTKDVARRHAVPTATSETGEPNVEEILCQEDVEDGTETHSIDVPSAVANTNFNTNSPEDGQTNCMAGKTETERTAMTAITSEERRAGGHN